MDTSLLLMIIVGEEDLPQWEEKRKTPNIMEEPSDGLQEKQKHGRSYGTDKNLVLFVVDRRRIAV